MVRRKELYPLEAYLDAADLALARDRASLNTLMERMSDRDEGLRWWAVVRAASAGKAGLAGD